MKVRYTAAAGGQPAIQVPGFGYIGIGQEVEVTEAQAEAWTAHGKGEHANFELVKEPKAKKDEPAAAEPAPAEAGASSAEDGE